MNPSAGLIALSVLVLGAANGALAADAANPACGAALDLILSIPKHGKHSTPLVVAEAPDSAETKDLTPETVLEDGWWGERPSQDHIDVFMGQLPVSILDSCPGLDAELGKAKIASGQAAVDQATTVNDDIVSLPTYPANVLSLSLPVMSEDGHDALVQDSLCGGVNQCSSGILLLRREKGGRWKPVGGLGPSPSSS
jgi:hypothetical protein